MLVTGTPAWQNLTKYRAEIGSSSLADLILKDEHRLESSETAFDGIRLNYALNFVTPRALELLLQLAEQQKLSFWRDQMFSGVKINNTEKRAVLHTALRQKDGRVETAGEDVMPLIQDARQKIAAFVEAVRSETWKGATGLPIKHVVNIGIGGSDLGPRLAVHALAPFVSGLTPHFVANADAFDITSTLRDLDPAETLFVVVSKTFTTQETLLNARSAREWLVAKLGEAAVSRHFIAVSTNLDAVLSFGIAPENVFPMWDWVGGRFSLWSSVGVSVALAIGIKNFNALLDGAAAMDTHFRTAAPAKNMPLLLALLGIWQRNFLGATSLAILPYSERLRDLPRFLQQLEMESNGKSVTRDGSRLITGRRPSCSARAEP